MLLHNIDASTIALEMENQRGKYLTVKNQFTVGTYQSVLYTLLSHMILEFTRPSEGSHHFVVEKTNSQRIRLLPKWEIFLNNIVFTNACILTENI